MSKRFWWDVAMGAGDGIILPFVVTAVLAGAGLNAIKIFYIGAIVVAIGSLLEIISSFLSAKEQNETFDLGTYQPDHISKEWEEEDERMVILDLNRNTREDAHREFVEEKDRWKNFILGYDLHLNLSHKNKLLLSSLLIGISYLISGLFAVHGFYGTKDAKNGFFIGLIIVAFITAIVCLIKSRINKENFFTLILRAELLAIGAAVSAYFIGTLFNQSVVS